MREYEGTLEGRNAVAEALRAGRPIDKLYIAKGGTDHTLARLAAQAKAAGLVVVEVDRRKLDAMSATHSHQGIIAIAAATPYATVEDILHRSSNAGDSPLLVACDAISDPHNLGAVVRSAECAGAHGVIVPKRHSAGLTAVTDKASAGALSYLPVARVANLAATLEALKERGLWIFGAAAEGNTPLWRADFTLPTCLVIGSEGEGMGRLIRERCDFLVSIPLRGKIGSLNASAAAAVLLYEVLRQRTAAPEGNCL